MLVYVSPGSPIHSILREAMVLEEHRTGAPNFVEIFCDRTDAKMLLDAAKFICPPAIQEIEQSLELSRVLH
jgi:hypothetical protein